MGKAVAIKRGAGGKGHASAKSRTGSPECSQAVSDWKTKGMTPAIAAILGKCRAKAHARKQADLHRAAGNEAKAQVLEHRAATGVVGKEARLARARELMAGRKAKAGNTAAPAAATPSLREQAAAHRAGKGGDVARIEQLQQRAVARAESIRQRGTALDKQHRELLDAARRARGKRAEKEAAAQAFYDQNKPQADRLLSGFNTVVGRGEKLAAARRVAVAARRTGGDKEAARKRVELADALTANRYLQKPERYDSRAGRSVRHQTRREELAIHNQLGQLSGNRDSYTATDAAATARMQASAQKRMANRQVRAEQQKSERAAAAQAAQRSRDEAERRYIRDQRAQKRATPEAVARARQAVAARREQAGKDRYERTRDNLLDYGRGHAPSRPTKGTVAQREAAYAKRKELADKIRSEHRKLVATPEGQARVKAQNARAETRFAAKNRLGLNFGESPTPPKPAPISAPGRNTPERLARAQGIRAGRKMLAGPERQAFIERARATRAGKAPATASTPAHPYEGRGFTPLDLTKKAEWHEFQAGAARLHGMTAASDKHERIAAAIRRSIPPEKPLPPMNPRAKTKRAASRPDVTKSPEFAAARSRASDRAAAVRRRYERLGAKTSNAQMDMTESRYAKAEQLRATRKSKAPATPKPAPSVTTPPDRLARARQLRAARKSRDSEAMFEARSAARAAHGQRELALAKAALPHVTPELESKVARAFLATDKGHNFVHMRDLRSALPDVPKPHLDAAILKGRQEGRYAMDSHEGLTGVSTRSQRRAGIFQQQSPSSRLEYLSARDTGSVKALAGPVEQARAVVAKHAKAQGRGTAERLERARAVREARTIDAQRERRVKVEAHDRLSNSGYHRSGKSNWWLRDASMKEGGFVNSLPRTRGDERLTASVALKPGSYTLGTGKGKDAIRQTINVKPKTGRKGVKTRVAAILAQRAR